MQGKKGFYCLGLVVRGTADKGHVVMITSYHVVVYRLIMFTNVFVDYNE